MGAIEFIIFYVIVINVVGFLIMGIDKKKAVKHAWRVPEATLFTIAIIGGSIGSILGMQIFRHKTRRWHFVYGMPAILIIQILLIIALLNSPIEFGVI